jgi:hypothetical protein
MSDKAFTLKEIRSAMNKHNKEMDNDVRVKIVGGEMKFSSAKASQMKLQQAPAQPPKSVPKKKKQPDLKGQPKITEMMSKK